MWAESKKQKNKPNESQRHANAKYVSKLKHFNLTGLASGGDIIVSIGRQIRCVVVTPEKAVLDQQVDMVCLPMVDGELGVLPGRLAMIGNMLPGVLRLNSGNQMKRLFIDGGFVQVRSDTVNLLKSMGKQHARLFQPRLQKKVLRNLSTTILSHCGVPGPC